jgi:hypothetical protein
MAEMKKRDVQYLFTLAAMVFLVGGNIAYFVIHRNIMPLDMQKSLLTAIFSFIIISSPMYLMLILDKITGGSHGQKTDSKDHSRSGDAGTDGGNGTT